MSTFSSNDVTKLKQLVEQGIQVSQEVEMLKDGLKDTVKAVAEELNIKPAVLNKAIRIAYKAEMGKTREDFEELESILESVGRNI